MAADDLCLRIYLVRHALVGDEIFSICSSRHSTTHTCESLRYVTEMGTVGGGT